MRKTIILFAVLLIGTSVFAQQRRTKSFMGWYLAKDEPAKVHEVKINLPTTIFVSYPEVSYEYILRPDISLGASLGVGLQDDLYPIKFGFNPYFRWFFGGNSKSLDKYGSGFFIEANGALLSRNIDKYNHDTFGGYSNFSTTTENTFGAGLGIAVGWKYLSSNNWVGEICWGVGRDFVNDDAYPRLGISIGKRF